MPLHFAEFNVPVTIQRIAGSDKVKMHLNNLGFVVGESVTVVNKVNENLIVKVKGVTFGLSHELANRIYV